MPSGSPKSSPGTSDQRESTLGREAANVAGWVRYHPATSSALGEQKANVIRWRTVALRTCTVSFAGPSGVRHSVEVTAESIYEAAALGISALKSDGWVDAIAPGTELEIQVREPATCHRLTLRQIRRWCDGVAVSPDETLKKRRLRQLLA